MKVLIQVIKKYKPCKCNIIEKKMKMINSLKTIFHPNQILIGLRQVNCVFN